MKLLCNRTYQTCARMAFGVCQPARAVYDHTSASAKHPNLRCEANSIVRVANIDDCEQIYALLQSCGFGWSKDVVQDTLSNENILTLLSEVEGDIAGGIVCVRVLDEAQIQMIATRAKYRNRGIATSLIKAIFSKFGAKCQFLLEVKSTNTAAIRLYQKLSFQVYATRLKYYSDNSDALMMHIPLE